MVQAMYSAVAGVQAHQTRLDVIGNNIANVNTVGYKSARTTFVDQLSQTMRGASRPQNGMGGVNPVQVGLGVKVGSITTQQTQGALQQTGRPSDLSIQGNGFFLVGDGAAAYYSRDGAFTLDAEGSLVSATTGMKLLGWQANAAGTVDTSGPVTPTASIKIPVGTLTSVKATENMEFAGNLDATVNPGASYARTGQVFDSLGNPHEVKFTFRRDSLLLGGNLDQAAANGTAVTKNIQVYDQANTAHDVTFTYTKTGANAWSFAATSPTIPAWTSGNTGALTFNAAGVLTSGALPNLVAATPKINFSLSPQLSQIASASNPSLAGANDWNYTATSPSGVITNGTGALNFSAAGKLTSIPASFSLALSNGATSPISIKPDISKVSQLSGQSTANAVSQDGAPFGTLQSYNIGDDGTVTGIFSNGLNRDLGRVAVAQFANPSGLDKMGSNLFRPTNNSGSPQVNPPGVSGGGRVSAGFLEQSNVNLADEFTNMIITQRGFQANTRIVTAADEILQDLIQMKR